MILVEGRPWKLLLEPGPFISQKGYLGRGVGKRWWGQVLRVASSSSHGESLRPSPILEWAQWFSNPGMLRINQRAFKKTDPGCPGEWSSKGLGNLFTWKAPGDANAAC